MLSVSKYTQDYIDDCRAAVDAQISTYRDLIAAAREVAPAGGARLESAIEAFEPRFFNNMVLVLDNLFCHRSRTMEKKDGKPLNEARVLCNSLMLNDGRIAADKAIRLDPAKSLLGYQIGDEIRLSEEGYVRLSQAFFAGVERKYL
jgi:hypothetical protein